MEPCAPGTEDDPPIMYSTLNKQANEKERLLKQKAVLRNGKYDNVFELSYVNGSEHWFCNACQCPIMGRVYQHEIGKRHSQNLSLNTHHAERYPKEDQEEEQEEQPIAIEIAPGEPVPPGFEGEIGRVSQIQERLDGFKVGPLIALEYLLELQDYDVSKEPVYLCILCDKKGDPRTVLTHLASYNHISQYLQKHFPTCYRALAPYMTKQYKRNWQTTLQKIAEAIEKKFGRLKPYPIEKEKFENDRQHYSNLISKGRHFSEISGYTFEELIVHDELTKAYPEDEKQSFELSTSVNWGAQAFIQKPFKKRSPSPPVVATPNKKVRGNAQTNPKKQTPAYGSSTQSNATSGQPPQNRRRSSLSSVSSISSSDLSDGEMEKRRRSPSKLPKQRTPPHQRGRPPVYERRRSPSPAAVRRASPRRGPDGRQMPWQNPNYQRQKNEFAEKKMTDKERERIRKIEEFRKLARAIENDMHKTLKQHEKNPEKHPHYNEEWKKFWNRRYKELQGQGVDVAKHDFKPEWIQFWNRRMVELHSDELRGKKDALRKRLGLPDEPNPIKFRIGITPGKASPKENKPNLPMAAQPDQDNEVIIIDDKEDDVKPAPRSRSPWERQSPLLNKSRPSARMRRSRSSSLTLRMSPGANNNIHQHSRSRERSPKEVMRRRSKSRERVGLPPSSKRSRSPPPKDYRELRERRSRDLSRERDRDREDRSRERERDREDRSRERERDRGDRDRERMERGRRSRSRERSWERRELMEKKRDYRESSYERDMRGRERVRTVADLPWEREKAYRHQFEEYYKPPPIMRDVTRKPVLHPGEVPLIPIAMPPDDDDEGEVNVIDVLRLLTALEERLGSLGPKVIDMLAQALALEKKEANSSETLLDNDINCVLFETAKEKLKGQLLAGLVDMVQERAFKKAIKKTATLLHMASQRKRQRERLLPRVKPVTVPGVGTVDKAAIAKQIATALIMQGKTDVTQAELEQLINAVVGMAEAAKNSNKPMTTASFLHQLSAGSIALEDLAKPDKEISPTGDKIIIPTQCKQAAAAATVDNAKSEVVDLEKLTEPLTPSPGKSSAGANMQNLSDSDLQTLLQNFKDLSTDEQHNLINYLKKLEAHEPERVERLRKFVNLDANLKVKDDDHAENSNESKHREGRESPFSNRHGGVNPMVEEEVTKIESDDDAKDEEAVEEEEKPKKKPEEQRGERPPGLDSEDEDYTYEDVVKTVSKNVKDKELEVNMKLVHDSMKFETDKAKSDMDLKDAKALISNLMSNFSKSATSGNSVDLLGLGPTTTTTAAAAAHGPSTSTASIINAPDFVKTLGSINMANLASIVSNVKKMDTGGGGGGDKPLNFEPPSPLRTNKLNFDPAQLNNRPQSPNRRPFRGIIPDDGFAAMRDVGRMMDVNRGRDVGLGMGRDVGPMRDVGLGMGRDVGPMRDVGLGMGRDVGPGPLRDAGRDLGVVGGPRDRTFVQYPRNPAPYGTNYGNNYPQQQQPPPQQYGGMGMRPGFDPRRMENPRFGGNLGGQFSRPGGGGGYNNRW